MQEPSRRLYEAMPRLPWAAPPWPGSIYGYIKDVVRVHGLRVQVREESRNAHAADVILVNSYYSRESILRAYGCDAQVCYLGLDTAVFANRHQSREDFVVGLGAFAPEKGMERAVAAVSLIPPPRPRLVWVGNAANPRYLQAMQQLARERGVQLEPHVSIPDSELVDMLNRCALMICTPRLEPFGLAPLEANACGAPVVAIAEGGIREAITDGVNGLLGDDSAGLAAAMQRLLSDRGYARDLGQNGAALVRERWSLDAAIDRIEARLLAAAAAAST